MNTIEIVRQSNSSLISQGLPLGVTNVSSTVTNNNLTGISSLNGLSGTVLLTGAGETVVSINGQIITVTSTSSASAATSGLATSGFCTGISGVLQNQVNILNNTTGLFYLNSNPSGYITGFNSGIYVTTGQTGQFYPASNPNQYVNSGNLYQTGANLDSKINSLSGISVLTYGNQNINGLKTFSTGIQVSGNGIDLLNTSNPAHQEGRVFYDNTEKTLAYYNDNTELTVNIGQEEIVRVVNKFGSDIANGTIVYISGSQGNRPRIYPAIANQTNADLVIGVATNTIINNNNGYITTQGIVRGLDLSLFTEGDLVYLSETVTGAFRLGPPAPPNHILKVGTVLNNSAINGALFIKPEHIDYNLSYLHDIYISTGTLSNGDLLVYNQTSGKWLNQPNFSGILQSQINIINNNTGQFYLSSNPQQYVNSGNLYSTGNSLQNQINSINSNTGQFYLNSNPYQYIRSGDVSSVYSTITNLQSTGANLQSQVNNLNSNTGNYYLNSNPSGFISNNTLSNYLVSVPSIDITDHFIQRQDGGTTYQSPWLQTFGANGGGAVFSTEIDTGGHPGIVRLNLTSNSNSYAGLTSQPSLVQLGYGPALFETMIRWGDLSGQRSYIFAGLIDAGQGTTITDGVGFKFQNNSGFSTGVITPFIRRNSSETSSAVVVTGNRDTWYYLSCSVNSLATIASFSIKNETGLSIINTQLSGVNMPTGASRQVGAGIIYYRDQGVTSNYMYCDWYRLKLQPFA